VISGRPRLGGDPTLVGRGSRKTLEFRGAVVRQGPRLGTSQMLPTIRKVCTGTLAKPIRSFGSLALPYLLSEQQSTHENGGDGSGQVGE
jgi:hypothetical protein